MKAVTCFIGIGTLAAVAAFAQAPSPPAAPQAPAPPPFGPPVGPGRTLQTSDMTNSNPLIPVDLYRSGSVSHQDLATFAWLEFISAVSPSARAVAASPAAASPPRAPVLPRR